MRFAAKLGPSKKGRGLGAGDGLVGIDRLMQNVRHGRFERSLAGLTGVGALITGVEIWLEHDRASFANRMMWIPVALTPAMAAAGIAGVFSKRAAKTFLPLISSVVLFNSMQGEYLHLRGIAQRPGGFGRNLRSITPRWVHPLSPPFSSALWVAWGSLPPFSAGKDRRVGLTPGSAEHRFPGYDVMRQQTAWDEVTRSVVTARLGSTDPPLFFTAEEEPIAARCWTGSWPKTKTPASPYSRSSTNVSPRDVATVSATRICPMIRRRGVSPLPR